MRFTWKVSSNLDRCNSRTWSVILLIANTAANVKVRKALRSLRRVIPYIGFNGSIGLSLLAARTKMRGTLRHQQPPDRRATTHTRLPGPLIDPVADLEEAFPPLRIHIVRNGTAPRRVCLAGCRLEDRKRTR